jgi:hypothetical protein
MTTLMPKTERRTYISRIDISRRKAGKGRGTSGAPVIVLKRARKTCEVLALFGKLPILRGCMRKVFSDV